MKTFVILGLLLVLVMLTTALARSPLPKEGSGTMDAVISEDGNVGASPSGTPSSQIGDDAAGSSVLFAMLLVQGLALAFLLWNGLSMMDSIAQQGWDVYLVDGRGYGGSTRPPEMDKPAQDNKQIVDTPTAVKDVGAAVEHILRKRKVAKINLMGWSWRTAIMGMYTTEHNDKVNRLVLYAPLWLFNSPPPIGADGPLGAHRWSQRTRPKSVAAGPRHVNGGRP